MMVDILLKATTVISILILVVLATLELFEVLYRRGVPVPGVYKSWRNDEIERIKEAMESVEDRRIGKIKDLIAEVYREDYSSLIKHEELRVKALLDQLEIRADEFSEYRSEIMKLCSPPAPSLEDCRDQLKDICLSDVVLIDQKALTNPHYTEVEYYVGLTDVMTDSDDYGMGSKLTQFMCDLIKSEYSKSRLSQCTIAVPTKGNYLLGYWVSNRLNVPFIKVRKTPRIRSSQYWDGKLDREKGIIIVHDVTVTADQLIESVDRLPNLMEVESVFSLVRRNDDRFLSYQDRLEVPLYSLVDINDDWLGNKL